MAVTEFQLTDAFTMDNFNSRIVETNNSFQPANNNLTEYVNNELQTVGGVAVSLPYAQIATGTYTGTGTYSLSSPNSLTFNFVPHGLLTISGAANLGVDNYCIIWLDDLSINEYKARGTCFSWENNYFYTTGLFAKKSPDSKTIYWYSKDSVNRQLNYLNGIYGYCVQG